MTTRKTTRKQPPATFVVASGDTWIIEYGRFQRDYVARDVDTGAVIGWAATETAARVLVQNHRSEVTA